MGGSDNRPVLAGSATATVVEVAVEAVEVVDALSATATTGIVPK